MERRRAGEEEQVTPGLYYGGFSYDDIGNWTETSRTGNTYYYLTSNILNQYTDVSTVWPMNTWNPTYDVDGNMLTGIIGWSYGWNGENRLISAENGDTRLEFNYDYMGRRFEKKVYTANVLTKHEKFVYDGYKLIQVLDTLNSDAVTMAFAWHPESTGLDTPFSMTYDGETYYYVTDGNKNVMSLIDAAGTKAAEYVYDPFGSAPPPRPVRWRKSIRSASAASITTTKPVSSTTTTATTAPNSADGSAATPSKKKAA